MCLGALKAGYIATKERYWVWMVLSYKGKILTVVGIDSDVLTVCTSFKFINTITRSINNTYEQVNSSVIARLSWKAGIVRRDLCSDSMRKSKK